MSKKSIKVIVSGVNIIEGGALKTLQNIIDELSKVGNIELICLVNSKNLFIADDSKNINFIEFPEIKKKWLRRVRFEYWQCKKISKELCPDIWISMHDITPSVSCKNRFVYCHNPSPFYKANFFDFKIDFNFFIFTLLYKYLYKINIHKNLGVIVQQDWLARSFNDWFGIENLIVAKPELLEVKLSGSKNENKMKEKKRMVKFIYPALPRTFKNFELICDAVALLKSKNNDAYSVLSIVLTISGDENKYSKYIYDKYSHLTAIKFVGRLTRDEINLHYKDTDALIFPSKLETWGLPITEAKENHLPLIVSDVPYSKETIGKYDKVVFVNADNPKQLADVIENCIDGKIQFSQSNYIKDPKYTHCDSWASLVNTILKISQP